MVTKKIKDVTIDDWVLTYKEDSESYEWVQPKFAGETPTASKQKIQLKMDNGSIIECTSDHKFFTTNRGWVEAENLTETDDIKEFNSESILK